MYKKSFYITWKKWNNAFSYNKRKNKKLYVPSIIELSNINKVELQIDKDKIAFEEFDFDWVLQTCYWLKNFYRIAWKDKEIILFDNHNHAFYFWLEAKSNWIINSNSTLFHIDEHADTREPDIYLSKEEANDLQKIFDYTNNDLNVWNYIIPAQKIWIVKDIIQIRNETNLNDYISWEYKLDWEVILNLDLDFFSRELDYIDYNLKKQVIIDIASRAKIITVASSPFFINQELALKVFKDIFS